MNLFKALFLMSKKNSDKSLDELVDSYSKIVYKGFIIAGPENFKSELMRKIDAIEDIFSGFYYYGYVLKNIKGFVYKKKFEFRNVQSLNGWILLDDNFVNLKERSLFLYTLRRALIVATITKVDKYDWVSIYKVKKWADKLSFKIASDFLRCGKHRIQ